jgi:hypothetical protein
MKSLLILGDVGRGWRMRLCLAAAVGLGLGVAGCTPSYVTGTDAPVNLYITAINSGSVLDSDVRNGVNSTFICPDVTKVSVAVRNKNPAAPVPNVPSAVLLKSYEVRYFRTDGRGVEGTDVPYRITGNLSLGIDVKNSGSEDVAIEVVRRQAKLEPPLSTINQTAVLTVMAEVTLYGETTAGMAVSASSRFQIDFGDFGDTLTACPTAG